MTAGSRPTLLDDILFVTSCVQLRFLEANIIDESVVGGVRRLQQIVESPQFRAKAAAAAAKENSTDPLLTVDGIVELTNATLDIVSGLEMNVDWIKNQTNRDTFGIIEQYATQYGFYRFQELIS